MGSSPSQAQYTLVRFGFHPSLSSPPNVISKRKRAAKTFRRYRAFQRGQKRPGVAIRNWERGNFGEGSDVFDRQPFYVALRANAGRGGIAGIDRHIHDAAALHAIFI